MTEMSQAQRDRVIDTMIAEAGGDPERMSAVANVIANRAFADGRDPFEVVSAPNQFVGYSAPGSKSKAAMKDGAIRSLADAALDDALSGSSPDPTNGATSFHDASVSPSWADKMSRTTRIGGLSFYAPTSGPVQRNGAISGPPLSARTLTAYSRNPPSYSIADGANMGGVDKRLADIIANAATSMAAQGYRVEAFSGQKGRAAGTQNHPTGRAVDVRIFDPQGKELPNSPAQAKRMGVDLGPSVRAYEQFAQAARQYQLGTYPELTRDLRWGGYFEQGTKFDLMHMDISGGGMALGNWEKGYRPGALKGLPGTFANVAKSSKHRPLDRGHHGCHYHPRRPGLR